MKVESLDELKAAFDDWRSKKRYAREPVPKELMERASRTIGVHGLARVARATRIERSRLSGGRRGRGKSGKSRKVATSPAAVVPSFSRLELGAPSATTPIAEVETPTGLKVRIFAQTRETLGLLSSLCGIGGAP
jgi:hypothetical protein